MTEQWTDILGDYAIESSRLYGITDPSIEFLVGSRRQTSVHRPQNFLLRRSPLGTYEYMADLFDVLKTPLSASQGYRFRYMGRTLRMDVYHTAGLAVIGTLDENHADGRGNDAVSPSVSPPCPRIPTLPTD